MSLKNFFIRILANGIYFIRSKTLRKNNVRFLVFTGTSGKTLARTATTYALREKKFSVISPPFGYTNELGIVLAALDIESMSLFSFSGIKKIITSRPLNNTYACIELGVDWRSDISWFIKRFQPYGVCITNVSKNEWVRPLKKIWEDKELLIDQLPSDGFVCFSTHNDSIQMIRKMNLSHKKIHIIEFDSTTLTFHTPLAKFFPYTEAFSFALSCLQAIDTNSPVADTLFLNYQPPEGRFSKTLLSSGATLITDTYKAVPQCTSYVLTTGLSIPTKKHIAVVSAMHPLWTNKNMHYSNLGRILTHYDKVYFVGPSSIAKIVRVYIPNIIWVKNTSNYQELARSLRGEVGPETTLVIKGAIRYHLKHLEALLSG